MRWTLSTWNQVAPASFDFAQDKPCRQSRGRLDLGAAGGNARRTAAGTAALHFVIDSLTGHTWISGVV